MRDAINIIRFCTYVAIVSILGMVIFGAVSWSQNHTYDLDFLLYATLISIILIFAILSFTHPMKNKGAFKLNLLGIRWMRFKHLFRCVAGFFFGVAVFGVNHQNWAVELLHLLCTGLAILFAYLTLLFRYDHKKGRTLSLIAAIVGIGGFVGAWYFDYEIKDGEAIAAAPLIVWIFIELKNWK